MFRLIGRAISTLAILVMAQFLASSGQAQTGQAQNWPQRPVLLILPFGPGSGADIAARLLSDGLQKLWGQPVIVEGRPGGDGLISVRGVVNAKDDHIIFFGPTSAYVVHPYVHDNLGYDPETDLQPIAGVAKVQVAIAVSKSLGVASLAELVAYTKSHPEKLSYGVAPGFSEFVFNGFLRENDLKMVKVPYRDITQSPPDLGLGRIQLVMMSYAAMRAQEQVGDIKVLAMADTKRSAIAPDIPSAVEAGYPGLVASPVLGLMGHRDMPLDVRKKAAAGVLEALKDEAVIAGLSRSGQPAAPMGVEEFAAAVKDQHRQVAHLAQLLNIERKK
jgi:tripartite-type tricarboxylate transporter receptor subunit TctC